MPYTINEHRHRFCSWAAGRAASVSGCRVSGEQANNILKAVKLEKLLGNPNKLPAPRNMDDCHNEWRRKVIAAAKRRGLSRCTHGVAAKLINIYLKCGFVCGGYHTHERVKALHPPIDRMLLENLYSENFGDRRRFWKEVRKKGWSKLSSKLYQKVISNVRDSMPNQALWTVEQLLGGLPIVRGSGALRT